jgi:hypothetical protein
VARKPLSVISRPAGLEIRNRTNWRPRAQTLALLDQVQAVLDELGEQLPLMVRQIYYRLVAMYGYEKTERASKRLGEMLNMARRARVIPMDAIRDDGVTSEEPLFFDGAEGFLDTMVHWARDFRLDRQRGQKRRLVVMCEAAGMVPQLARIASPFGIEVRSGGRGFASVTDKHWLGELWARSSMPITVLQIGDYDRSGVPLFDNLEEDVNAFRANYGGEVVEFIRLAITPSRPSATTFPPRRPKKPTAAGSTSKSPGKQKRWIRACLPTSSVRRSRRGSTARSTRGARGRGGSAPRRDFAAARCLRPPADGGQAPPAGPGRTFG